MSKLPLSARGGVLFLLLLGILAWLSPALPLADPALPDSSQRLAAPQWTQAPYLGTDIHGRDLLARLLSGARVSLMVGLFGSLVALLIGVPWGALAGLLGGRTDRILMRLSDALQSVPLTVVVIFLLSLLGEYRNELAQIGFGRLQLFFVALGALFWLPTARMARAEALRLRNTTFVEAAQAAGAGRARLIFRHLVPNMAPALLSLLGLTLPRVILAEAFLSFLGLGVEPPAVSWGSLAADGLAALNPLVDAWWLLAFPAAMLAATLFALNLLADGWRGPRPTPTQIRLKKNTSAELA